MVDHRDVILVVLDHDLLGRCAAVVVRLDNLIVAVLGRRVESNGCRVHGLLLRMELVVGRLREERAARIAVVLLPLRFVLTHLNGNLIGSQIESNVAAAAG